MTLTDALDNTDSAAAIHRAALAHFNIADSLRIEGIALFCQEPAGADFRLLQRYDFNALDQQDCRMLSVAA